MKDEATPTPKDEGRPEHESNRIGKRIYLTPTSLNMFLRCPAQYQFRYEEKRVMRPSAYMTRGSAVHKGIEVNYLQKRETREDLPLEDVLDATRDEWGRKIEADDPDFRDEKPDKLLDSGIALATLYHEQIAPTTQPYLIEEKVYIESDRFDEDVSLVGYLDLVDDQDVLRDTKTASKSPPATDVDTSLQLTTYAMGYYQRTGVIPTVGIDALVSTKVPKVVQLRGTRTPEQFDRLAAITNEVAKSVKAGIFPPNDGGGWWCAPDRCGYWELCHKRFGGMR